MTKRTGIVIALIVPVLVAVGLTLAYFITKRMGPVAPIDMVEEKAGEVSVVEPERELKILMKSPEGEEIPISTDGVTIMFNKPMVPLTTLDAGRDLAIDVRITPEVSGKYFWLGTHGFIFRPTEAFAPATTYKISIPAGIAALDKTPLNESVEWEFSTVTPKVISWTPYPDGNSMILPANAAFTIIFNLSMDRADVEKKLSMTGKSVGKEISPVKAFKWYDDDHILRVEFPNGIPWDEEFTVTMPEGIHSKRGDLGSVKSSFAKYSTPSRILTIEGVYKSGSSSDTNLEPDKDEEIGFKSGICYKFSQPIREKSFEKAFSVTVVDSEIKPEVVYYNNGYESYQIIDKSGKITRLEGYDNACAIFADEPNQKYSFQIDPKQIKSLSGAILTSAAEKYLVHTAHTSAKIDSNLSKNIISLKSAPSIPYTVTNVSSLKITLFPLESADYREDIKSERFNGLKEYYDVKTRTHLAYDPPIGIFGYRDFELPVDLKTMTIDRERMKPLSAKEFDLDGVEDKPLKFGLDLAQLFPGAKIKPGIYLIEAHGDPLIKDGSSPRATYSVIQITPVALAMKREIDHLLVWASDIETGLPIPSLLLSVHGKGYDMDGATDENGVAIFQSPTRNLCVEVKMEEMKSFSCESLHRIIDNRALDNGNNLFAYIYTDRPIYRPGQTIYFSSFIRKMLEGRYFMPDEDTECSVKITNSRSEMIYDEISKISRGGIISGNFTLDNREDLPRGEYKIGVNCLRQNFTRKLVVTSYRKPSFKVDISSNRTELSSKENIEADVKGEYFFGAPLKRAKVTWSIMTATYIFSPKGYQDFSFIDEDLLQKRERFSFDDWEFDEEYFSDYEYDIVAESGMPEDTRGWMEDPRGSLAKRREGVYFKDLNSEDVSWIQKALDDSGQLKIGYKPNLAKYPTSQTLTVEASVSDPSNQQVSSAQDFIVHKAEYYLGLKPDKWAYGEGQKAIIDTISLNTKGEPVGAKKFSVDVLSREYKFSERLTSGGEWDWVFAPKDTKLESFEVTTDERGKGQVVYEIPKSGEYRFIAKATDTKGNSIRSATSISAWGKDFVPWKMDKPQDLGLVPDKDSYKVGETAKILIKSLVPTTKALMSIERGRILEYKIMDLEGNASHIEVPITEGMIPNIYVGVVAHAGRHGNQPPLLFAGETMLHVEPETKRLNIAIIPDRKGDDKNPSVYRPGDEVNVRIETKDASGKMVKAHVIVSVADESVLRLLDYQLPDLVKRFYFTRQNGVITSSSLISLKAGDGSGIGADKKRRVFKDTAHFESDVATDDNGVANFKFKLPDDLTTWVIEAIGITESKSVDAFDKELDEAKKSTPTGQIAMGTNLALSDGTSVGSARTSIMTALPVSLRFGLPRFAALGDEVKGSVIINNMNSQPSDGIVSLTITGNGFFANEKNRQEIPFSIPAKSESTYPIDIAVKGGEGRFVLSAEAKDKGGKTIDGTEVSIPVDDRYAPEVVATSGISRGDKKEAILVPQDVDQNLGGLDITMKASMGLVAAEPMKNLIYFPFGCSEQKSSSLLALLMAKDLISKYGEKYFDSLAPFKEWEIPKKAGFDEKLKLIDDRINNILSELIIKFQSRDGGIVYWPDAGSVSSYYPSVQVFWAMNLAQKIGFQIDESGYGKLADYILKQIEMLNNYEKDVWGLSDDMKAYGLWALSLDGRWSDTVASNLTKTSANLTNPGYSFLLMAIANHGGGVDPKPVLDRLHATAKQEPRHTSWPSSYFFWSSSVKNTALAAHALLINDPNDPLLPRAMTFILNRKNTGCPMCTQDNLYVSWLAYDFAKIFREDKTDFEASAKVGGKSRSKKEFDSDTLLDINFNHIPMSEISKMSMPADVDIIRDGDGTLYYDMVLKYYLPPERTPTREEGLIISREYYDIDDVKETMPLTSFKIGATYKAHMVLTVPQDMNYIMVQDLLPAGFEPMDMTLATTSRAAQTMADAGEGNEGGGDDEIVFRYGYDDVIKLPDFSSDFGFSHQEIRDDSILWSDKILPAGVYHIKYPVRATTAGKYLMPGAVAYEFYEPEVFGRSRMRMIEIK